jgi:hypothetical protein
MPTNGEVAPRLGGEFHSKACTLLRKLGYRELINKKFGVDFGADIPSARNRIFRPLFAPNGKTAFEFKEGISVNISSEAENLKTKIDNLNDEQNDEFSEISGGVIFTDNKVGNTARSKALERNVYCWDIRYLHLLAKKIQILTDAISNKQLKEKQLDDWTTYFFVPEAYPGFIQLNAYLFYHNPIEQISIEGLESIFDRFKCILADYSDLGLRLIVRFKLHSLAEIPVGAGEKLKELLEDSEVVKYEHQQCYALSYHLAPWYVYCRELL